MDVRSVEVGRGLRLMFWGEFLFMAALLCSMLSILTSLLPLAAKVLAAASFLLSLVGLVTAAHACKGYQGALAFLVVSIILWAATNWVESGWPAALLNTACIIANYGMVVGVCAASANLLLRRQDAGYARYTKMRVHYLICSAASAACFLVGAMSRLGALAEIVWITGTVVGLFAGVIYLLFLWNIKELLIE